MLNSEFTKPIFALEGIGGSGKSHIGQIVARRLKNQGFSVLYHKIGGLGDSPRVRTLKRIMAYRHELLKEGKASPKQISDFKRERIFRLGMRQQLKEFVKLQRRPHDLALIDRTPLMIWVYAKASENSVNPNPFLGEIYDEVVSLTRRLRVTRVLLFDLSPETAYSRIIFRYSSGRQNISKLIGDACNAIKASNSESHIIKEKVMSLVSQSNKLQKKEFESWDLIPIQVTRKECELHKKILSKCYREFNLNWEIIDAEQTIRNVSELMLEKIRSHLLKCNIISKNSARLSQMNL